MTNSNENVLKFGDKSYSPNDLTDQQKYFANQIQSLQEQRKNQQFAIDQLTAALEFFTGQLISSLQQEDEKEDSSSAG
tara:strand:- start:231 stop:464 length:234 start_codon:yes stop_codon:yes gene_type:complete